MMNISDDIKYVGCDDSTLDLFEGQYKLNYGVTYNSYVILDEKIAIMDTVDKRTTDEWISNLENVLGDKIPDYLVVQHLEPDHSGSMQVLAQKYPGMDIVCSERAAAMVPQFVNMDLSKRIISVKEGDTLTLGNHTLTFIMAPMVHWPEVMMTYDAVSKTLFSADGFGTFGDSRNRISWIVEARRYYFNIIGKYGTSVQNVLKKAENLDIKNIAPLHGPALGKDVSEYIEYYKKWSSYEPEKSGVLIAYASPHGNTKEAALYMKKLLEDRGEKVVVIDLNRGDMARAVEGAFCFDRTVIAGTTYDGALFPSVMDFLYHLQVKNFQKRTFGIIENGSWAPSSGRRIKDELGKMKEITVLDPIVSIRTQKKPADDSQFAALADALVMAGKNN
ncbi:MAG: FprA family A-type flavoprotein [Lachnospiraceae bacterium]|nr:FprA family A-type flavoprotein [Lachnospiraceae bacterium]